MNPVTQNINTSKPWYQINSSSGLVSVDIRPMLVLAVLGYIAWKKFK